MRGRVIDGQDASALYPIFTSKDAVWRSKAYKIAILLCCLKRATRKSYLYEIMCSQLRSASLCMFSVKKTPTTGLKEVQRQAGNTPILCGWRTRSPNQH